MMHRRLPPIGLLILTCAWCVLPTVLPASMARLAVSAQVAAPTTVDPALYQDLRWRSVGPTRGGRVTAVAGVRTEPGTFYMGATGGGVWKTTNAGILWEPVTDGQIETGSIGAIDVADSNPSIVYVGTGSAALRSNVIQGRGVYKSSDAGTTWTFVGLKNVGQIGSIRVHPQNPEIAFVAAVGQPFSPGADRGVFRTRDGGRTWSKVLFINDRTGAVALALNHANPDEIYAGAWRAERKGWTITSGGPASEGGLYKSMDGGTTWTHLTQGLPRTLAGKVDVEIARSRPSVVYALIEAPGDEGGLYRSEDSGASWAQVSAAPRLLTRPFYYTYVDVNPKNENEVWVNNLSLHKSIDGGKTWTTVATPHGDNHGIWFNPDKPEIFIQSNDGGANVTQDGGRSWSTQLNQPTGEFYMVSVDERFPYRLYAPQQDNTTVVVPSFPTTFWAALPTQLWSEGPGCETGQIHPRPDGRIIYGVCKGEFGRYSLATGQEKHYWVYPQNRYGHNPRDMKYRFQRQSPFELSPHDPDVIYHGSQFLHRTTDEGVTWDTISPDLTANEPDKQVISGGPITRDITGEEVYSTLYAVKESRLEKGVIWTGANDGPVHVTRDGGRTWSNVTPRGLPPGGRVQNIEDSPHRKGGAYIAVYRYLRDDDWQPYIYATDDYGATWTRLTDGTNGIPADWPTRVVREDPDRAGLLYAGTEFGLFVSFDNGRAWQSLQQNLPSTPITDIRVHRGDLVISTMGRGMWIMDDVGVLQQLARRSDSPDSAVREVHLFQPRPAWRMQYVASGFSADRPEFPPPGARIDYAFASEPTGEVTIEILDAAGGSIRTYASTGPASGPVLTQQMRMVQLGFEGPPRVFTRKGMNRFVWDLRHAGAWSPTAPQGEDGGPTVAPGTYTARLTAAGVTRTTTFEVRVDPRVAADGVTQADLEEQVAFNLKVRDAISAARQVVAQLAEVREKKRQDPAAVKALDALRARLVTAGGAYPQPMLIDQFGNLARMVGQADQKIGRDAFLRYEDLMKELASIQAELPRD